VIINCHSYFSLRYGALSLQECIDFAEQNDHSVLGITEINATTTLHDFLRVTQKKTNLTPIWGVDFRNGATCLYVVYTNCFAGVEEISNFLSTHLHEKKQFPEQAPVFQSCWVVYPFKQIKLKKFSLRSNEFIGVQAEDLPIFERSPWNNERKKAIAWQTCTFRNQRHLNMHQLLRCIEQNCLLTKLNPEDQGSSSDIFVSAEEFYGRFLNAPDLLDQLQMFIQHTRWTEFHLLSQPRNLQVYTSSEAEDALLLRQLALEGIEYRYGNSSTIQEMVLPRLEKELAIIEEKKFLSYFLINWDITQYARNKGYYYVGRGSGANSLVAFLLRITDVDPIELDLYFERFINLYRQNPPDFDIDFSWTDREDITQYIFHRFPHVALLGAYNTFQYKAIVRELGKVFGLPKDEIDFLCDGKFNPNNLDKNQLHVLKYASLLQDFPNSLAIHSAGILIANEPIHRTGATFLPPKGFPTVQFDMVVAEDIGLHKFDILSQRGLAKIKEATELVLQQHNIALDLHQIREFKNDPNIKALLTSAQAIGCFYVESPAMRMLMTKLQVDTYLGLVAASSVIRPGVSSSGMMKEYILRHRNPEMRKNAHPQLLEIMPETYGVMVYQEDVIKVAHHFGGLSLAEADVLRRGMSGKFRGREEFEHAKSAFFQNAIQKGNALEDVQEIWRQIESFAGYAFAKGHSASYAVESFQSLYLKAYYPLEYMTATVNHFGGFYDTEIYLLEAKRHGAAIEPPCIFHSQVHSILIEKTILLGFSLIKGLESNTIQKIIAFNQIDACKSVSHFMHETGISVEQITLLIRCGCFRKLEKSKKQLLWEAHFHGNKKKSQPTPSLFLPEEKNLNLPVLEDNWIEDAYDQMELFEFPLINPFDLIDHFPVVPVSQTLQNLVGKSVHVLGYLVNTKRTKTQTGELMLFGTFFDCHWHFFDTVHFPNTLSHAQFRGRGVYKIEGVVSEEFGAFTIEAKSAEKIPYKKDPRYAERK
jgi:DNA polymerase-3 subunit alpha